MSDKPLDNLLDGRGMITPTLLAKYWGVHVATVHRAIKKKALRAYRLPGGQVRISLYDAKRFGRPI